MIFLKKRYIKTAGSILTILALVYLFSRFYKSGISFPESTGLPRLFLIFLIPSALYAVILTVLIWNWQTLIRLFTGKTLALHKLASIYLKSNIGKYLPGNIMHLVGRGVLLERHLIGKREKIWSIAGENILLAFTALLVNSALLISGAIPEFKQALNIFISHLSGMATIAVIVLIPATLGTLYVIRKKKKIFPNLHNPGIRLPMLLLSNTVSIFLIGMISVAAALLLFPGSIQHSLIPTIFAAGTLSWMIGFITPGAPGGIGIREVIFHELLITQMKEPEILMILLIQRLACSGADFIGFLVSLKMKPEKNGIPIKNQNKKTT